jgi:hypothetical protein
MGYTLIMNLISITLGIPLVSSLGSHDIAPVDFSLVAYWAHFMLPVKWIILSFVMTVLIEFMCLVIILKVFEHIRLIPPRIMQEAAHESARPDFWPPSKINNPLIEIFKFSITANLASYVLTFTAPYVVALFLFVIKG